MDSENRNTASSDSGSAAKPFAESAERPESRDERSTEEMFQTLHLRFRELIDYFAYYVVTRIDAVRFAIKRKIIWLSLVALGVLAAAGAIVTAVVLLCAGVADGLSELFGRRWAGELVTGVILIGVTCVAGYFSLKRMFTQSHRERMAKYAALRARQRRRHGHDIGERARQHEGEEGGGHG